MRRAREKKTQANHTKVNNLQWSSKKQTKANFEI